MGICLNRELVVTIPENESDSSDSSTSPISELKPVNINKVKENDIIKSNYTRKQIQDIYYSELKKFKFY